MDVMSLSTGGVSLEFTEAETDAVWSGLRQAAQQMKLSCAITTTPAATFDYVEIAGTKLILMTDDGDPALLSTSALGERLLWAVADANRVPGPAGRAAA